MGANPKKSIPIEKYTPLFCGYVDSPYSLVYSNQLRLSKGKETSAAAFFEPLLLYLVLFFPGLGGTNAVNELIPFSSIRELNRIISYTLPGLALLWYLILKKNSLSLSKETLKPKLEDAYSFFWAFPGLILIGLGISLLIAQISPFSAPPKVQAPENILGWMAMISSCIGTGYLEESFFRFYLLQKLGEWVSSKTPRIIFSVLLFAFCHVYEGPWGILNAALAGLLLSILFERYKSLHGIAMAHSFYNAFVYAMGSFI